MINENRELTWNVLDIPVYGTLTGPGGRGKLPAVILIAGSGPTDRNWCSPLLPGTNGSGNLLAEKLSENGFVTLRYDKLASGPRARGNLPRFTGKISMQSHMDELTGAIRTLIGEENVDRERIFALTNSEGAIHAVNYQMNGNGQKFCGMILTGAPGRSVGDVARGQIKALCENLPDADVIMGRYDRAISEFIAGKPITIDPVFPDLVKQVLQSLEFPPNLPFSKELWTYRLGEYIGRISDPVMVLTGKKDIQVNWKADGKILEEALSKHKGASFAYPDNANHVLKHEDLPLEKLTAEYVSMHYNAGDAFLDSDAENRILGWLGKYL
jgi:hypothetical protein